VHKWLTWSAANAEVDRHEGVARTVLLTPRVEPSKTAAMPGTDGCVGTVAEVSNAGVGVMATQAESKRRQRRNKRAVGRFDFNWR